jgi:ABC-2 type transport system permease protein
MKDPIALWLKYIKQAIRSQLQYRASFLMKVFGQLILHALEVVVVLALFDRFGALKGWRLPEVLLFYGIVNISFAVAEGIGRGFDMFSRLVKSGDFDIMLLRPRSTALQVAVSDFQLMRLGRLIQGLAVLIWGMMVVDITWSALRIMIMLFSISGAICLFYGLFVLQATISFWTIESLEVMNMFTYGGVQATQYPLEIYQKWFRHFFIFIIPLGCVTYFPVVAILGRPDTIFNSPFGLQIFTPLIGLVFLVLSLRIWQFGVKHYRSTGS